jgi:hypothetical protein
VVGDDVLSRVDAGDNSGKRNPPVGRPTRDLADLWIFKVRKIVTLRAGGITRLDRIRVSV